MLLQRNLQLMRRVKKPEEGFGDRKYAISVMITILFPDPEASKR